MIDNFDLQTSRFHNLNKKVKPHNFNEVLKWELNSDARPYWPEHVPGRIDHAPSRWESGIRISYVGHASLLIQLDGINILTDPIWSERTSPLSFLGPKRIIQPGIKFEHLPNIDYVLISHNHYDHLDIPTLKKLVASFNPLIITPLKNDLIIYKHIPDAKIITLDWGQNFTLSSKEIKFNLEPAQHWSARSLFDKNLALWGSFVINAGERNIFFAGDSGYCPSLFKKIGLKYSNIIVSLIPIGAYLPRWFMQDMHMDPKEAIQTFLDLKSQFAIAMHFDVFPLAEDSFNQAKLELVEELSNVNISQEIFKIPKVGRAYFFEV